jgi:hypothetical protein
LKKTKAARDFLIDKVKILCYTLIKIKEEAIHMTLYDELYFEITLKGSKDELRKFARYLLSGALDDFFEVSEDFICYDDGFASADGSTACEMTFTNDDFGIEIDEFSPEEFLDEFCKAARTLEVQGHMYDADDEEFHFFSEAGDPYFLNSRKARSFNDELDAQADAEEFDDED